MSKEMTIAASEARAKFSMLLHRVRRGASFSITLHGEVAARLVPVHTPRREHIQAVIAGLKANRSILNPSGMKKLRVKDLVHAGRP
jgi:prevent-host-death family protein